MIPINRQICNINRPHVVILGAGASIASCPYGDRYGKKLPDMKNITELLDIDKILNTYGITLSSNNFEVLYSELIYEQKYKEPLELIEKKVIEYFSDLELPENPTIYDYLVLSLRPKDVIATFNWDPFLLQALERNHNFTKGPHYYFPHGCAAIGWCEKDKKQGRNGNACTICGEMYKPTKLLYPIKEKNYNSDKYIASQWRNLQGALKEALVFTIFGYGAPSSDIEAISLMGQGWGRPENRRLEEIEIIDIKNDDILHGNWKDFIHSHHYRTYRNFDESIIYRYPRRTCEAIWSQLMELEFFEENIIPKNLSLIKLQE